MDGFELADSDSAPMDASIIICTRNRSSALRQSLARLAEMSIPAATRFEVVIVDNGSVDDTQTIVEAASATLPLKYVREERRGAAWARNAGLAATRGQLVFVTDDDCLVRQDWLEAGLKLLKGNPRQMIGGRVDLHDRRDLPITTKTDTDPATLTSVAELYGFLHGCNMIFGRCVVEEIGSFDPLLGAGTRCKAAEDTDLVYRAFKAEIPVSYCPKLIVEHNHGRREPQVGAALERGYIASFGSMVTKHFLSGRFDLLKVLYWHIRADASKRRPGRWPQYLIGAIRYLQSALSYRTRPSGR